MRPILLLLALALVAGCSEDDAKLTAEEYRDKANALCAEANRAVARIDPPSAPREFAGFLERGLDLSKEYEDRFRVLDPPDQLEGLHDRALRLNDEFERDFERLIERIRQADDPIAVFQRELQRLLPSIQEGDELNRKLGLDECLQSPALRGAGPGPS